MEAKISKIKVAGFKGRFKKRSVHCGNFSARRTGWPKLVWQGLVLCYT
jgi:hypothetical protein